MRFWFARSSEVSIHEQLVTQVVLGIVSGELEPGHRLPSTRELARRFHLHANTVSTGYRELERQGWVKSRKGSGVFVCDRRPTASAQPALALDGLIAGFFRDARAMGAPLTQVRTRLRHWLSLQPPDHFLVVEPDPELRAILIHELRRAVEFEVRGCSPEELSAPETCLGAVPVALPSRREIVRAALPPEAELIGLQVCSVPKSLLKYLPVASEVMVAVASRWPEFLKQAHTMLVAAGFAPESLLLRDARRRNWRIGLKSAAAVVCDSLTATAVPRDCLTIPFPLVSEDSLTELRRYCQMIRETDAG